MRRASAVLLAACLLLSGATAQRRRTLNDENFEHITQAATGQTTGVWFVNFCSPSARACKELAPEWEALGKELLHSQTAFMTTVDPHTSPRLRDRFGITHLPTLVLFRDRKMYRFSGKLTPGSDIKGQLERWVREEYASSPAQDVPPPPSPLAWLVKGLEAKAASVKHALETQDFRALALALLPVLGVCMLGLALMLAAAVRRKPKRD
ncbi:Thioredoxin domain-containing [Chlorella sorokiniana]|uniref:Thioredoxin domain-containing n=1 Tax=Chlorella sorokiniana TaxID=3076 RepID=A0A2P6TY44_CHLSO|nr:Thioredoxin domain-containing [Chlorella sorokiniana]|eukprot:PRW58989.1 Thioredoxin domain-containing [Chlorella sorokiniana]